MSLIFSTTASRSDLDALVNRLSPEEIALHGISVSISRFKDGDWLSFKSYGQLGSGRITNAAKIIFQDAVEAGHASRSPRPAKIHLLNIFAASDGEYRPVPMGLLQKMLFDENRKPVSPLAKDIIYGLSRLDEQSKKYSFLGYKVLAGLISQEILAGKPLPEKDFEELNSKRIAEVHVRAADMCRFQLLDDVKLPKNVVNLPENVRAALLKLHEGLKPLSLWADAQTTEGHSPSHDVGMDMALARIGHDGSQHYNRSFENKACASALQLRVAQIVGLLKGEPRFIYYNVQELPEPFRPYFGFNTKRDLNRSMAFGKPQPGSFESGVARLVLMKPERLFQVLDEYANRILTKEEAALVKNWWSETFCGPQPAAAPKAVQSPEP